MWILCLNSQDEHSIIQLTLRHQGGKAEMDFRIETALVNIENCRAQRLDLASLAAAAHLSYPYFSRLFKAQTGIPPSMYLKRHRLKLAEELLIETTLTIKEVGCAVGLLDQSHFVRDFAQMYGISPLAYRRRQRLAIGPSHRT